VNQVRAPASSRNTPRISGFTRSNPVWGRGWPVSGLTGEEFDGAVAVTVDAGTGEGFGIEVVPDVVAPETPDPLVIVRGGIVGGVNGGPVVIPGGATVVTVGVAVTAVVVGWVAVVELVVDTDVLVVVVVVSCDVVPPSWVVVCSVECVGSGWTGGCGLASATPPAKRSGRTRMRGSFFTFSLHSWEAVHSRNRLDKRGLTIVTAKPDLMSTPLPELVSAKHLPKRGFLLVAASAEPFRHQYLLKLIPLYQHS
jgi:hypothetical protein